MPSLFGGGDKCQGDRLMIHPNLPYKYSTLVFSSDRDAPPCVNMILRHAPLLVDPVATCDIEQ